MASMGKRLRNSLRKRLLRWHPVLRNRDRRVPVEWIDSRGAVPPSGRYCYFRIPKCANSTVVRTLSWYDPDLSLDETDFTGGTAKDEFRPLSDVPCLTVRGFTCRRFCFTFVRNPYTRLLSAYLDKMQNDRFQWVADRLGKKNVRECSFSEFVSFLENEGLFGNVHWIPQTSLLPVPVDSLALVGSVEALNDGLSSVVNTLFGPDTWSGSRDREHNRKGALEKVRSYYVEDLEARVFALYRKDFEVFGYPRLLDDCGQPGRPHGRSI
jgi:dermatan 4-sulfotransferase 1